MPFTAKLQGAHDDISALTAASRLEHAILSLIASILAFLIRHHETIAARTGGPIANLQSHTPSLRPYLVATTIFTSEAKATRRDRAQPQDPASNPPINPTAKPTPATPTAINPEPQSPPSPKTTLRLKTTRPNTQFKHA